MRPQNILRPVKLTTYLPEDLRAKLDLHLYSQVEGRIPHGAYAKFLSDRVIEFFEKERSPRELSEASIETALREERILQMEGLLTEIAMTDMRSGWSAARTADVVAKARKITGRIPR